MSRFHAMLLAAILLPTIGAAAEVASAVFTGTYFYNFENAKFTAKGSSACWAANGDLSKAEAHPKDGSAPWGSAIVVARGTLGPVGHFGNLGVCTRVITVIEVLEVRTRCQGSSLDRCSN
jgi:hypothetical protein